MLTIVLAVLVAGPGLKVRSANVESMMSNDQSILSERRLPCWNDGQVWQFGLLLGASIVVLYAINAYAAIVAQLCCGMPVADFGLLPILSIRIARTAPEA